MSTEYVSVSVEELQLGDWVKGRGRVSIVPYDHPTQDEYVMVEFTRRGETRLLGFRNDAVLSVKLVEES